MGSKMVATCSRSVRMHAVVGCFRSHSAAAARQHPLPDAESLNAQRGKRQGLCLLTAAALALAFGMSSAFAQKKYDPGASDTEIKIGNINPYSGPASAYGVIGKTIAAYFNKVNAEGGINGRKINFISYAVFYMTNKAVEQARRLVESDKVLLIFQSFGTP